MDRTTTRRLTILAVPALAALALAGCGASTASSPSSPAVVATSASTGSSPSQPSSSQPSSSPSTPEATTQAAAGGGCTLIDQSTAAQILGSPVTATKAGDVGTTTDTDGTITKLDGCLYTGSAGAIGYDVVKFDRLDSTQMLAMAKAKSSAQLKSGKALAFTSAVPGALAYTITLPSGTDSIVTTVKNGWMITVSATAKPADATVSAKRVDAAAAALLGNV